MPLIYFSMAQEGEIVGNAIMMQVGRSQLAAVPAVHYRSVFAYHVHRVCHGNTFRPDAIAVELEPEALSAAISWVRNFYKREQSSSHLPCMLGLICNGRQKGGNRYIERGNNSGLTHGPRLTAASSEQDKQILEIFPLSPTDSIVEAIRCAVELDIPVYGVDLEIAYPLSKKGIILQDPWLAFNDLEQYVRANETYAAALTNKTLDPLREACMTRRLKTILRRHRKVVFTCGIGHWKRISRCLADSDSQLRPVPVIETNLAGQYSPAVIHPLIAVRFMDLYPAVTSFYENERRNGFRSIGDSMKVDTAVAIFHQLIDRTYRSVFKAEEALHGMNSAAWDLSKRKSFEQFVTNLCFIDQRIVPGLATLVRAATGVMSSSFNRKMADILMEFGWARPEDYTEYNIVMPALDLQAGADRCTVFDPEGNRSADYRLCDRKWGYNWAAETPVPWYWSGEKSIFNKEKMASISRGWPPIDYLISALSARAFELADSIDERHRVEPFEGSLYKGVDIKATIRSHIEGKETIYVKNPFRRCVAVNSTTARLDPKVTIYRLGSGRSCKWFLHAGDMFKYHYHHVQDKARMREVAEKKGNDAVAGLSYIEPVILPAKMSELGIYAVDFLGMVFFCPACV